jgi:hypothetical protein
MPRARFRSPAGSSEGAVLLISKIPWFAAEFTQIFAVTRVNLSMHENFSSATDNSYYTTMSVRDSSNTCLHMRTYEVILRVLGNAFRT